MGAILLTRPDPDNDALAAALEALGVPVLRAPMLVDHAVRSDLPGATGLGGVIVTSRRALATFGEIVPDPDLFALPCFAVGPATGQAARAAGFATIHEAAGTGADLARRIAAKPPRGPLLYLAARDRSPDLEAGLADHGVPVLVRIVYAMEPARALPAPVATALADGAVTAAAFYSARSAAAFCALTRDSRFDTMRRALVCLCLSGACAEPLRAAGFARHRVATHPDGQVMARLVLDQAKNDGPHGARGET